MPTPGSAFIFRSHPIAPQAVGTCGLTACVSCRHGEKSRKILHVCGGHVKIVGQIFRGQIIVQGRKGSGELLQRVGNAVVNLAAGICDQGMLFGSFFAIRSPRH